MSDPVLLRHLLREKHWQTYRTFCIQYDKAAQSLDSSYVGTYPSRAQLHRWLSGDLKGLPYPQHCEVLETMFPGITVSEMFQPASSEEVLPDLTEPASGRTSHPRTERPVGLRPHIEEAFRSPCVRIDFAGFSGETLSNTLNEVLDKVRAGHLAPKSIAVRLMLSDPSVPLALPCRADTGADDPAVRRRATKITRRAVDGIVDGVQELADLGLVESAKAEVRAHSASPLFKLYLINDDEAFFGFYPVLEHTVTIDRQPVPIFDPMGKDATLFHFSADDPTGVANGSQYVSQARTWFDSMWATVAREYV